MALTAEQGTDASDASAADEYADGQRPLAAYSALSAAWLAAFTGSLLAARVAGKQLPQRYTLGDIVIAGVASHKISRMISRDKITSFARAPFMRYRGPGGKGEVREDPRGEGLRLAIGELLNCPYCLDHWVASAYGVGLVAAPRATRLVGFVATAETIADYMQLGYRTVHDRAGS